jgi:hypothetical protein
MERKDWKQVVEQVEHGEGGEQVREKEKAKEKQRRSKKRRDRERESENKSDCARKIEISPSAHIFILDVCQARPHQLLSSSSWERLGFTAVFG